MDRNDTDMYRSYINLAKLKLFFLILVLTTAEAETYLFQAKIKPLLQEDYTKTLLKLIKNAKKQINIIMFSMRYYDRYPNSPSNSLIKALKEATTKGVLVEVILEQSEEVTLKNSLQNQKVGIMLANAGVKVYLDSLHKTTHNKLIIIDNKYTVIGSFNWTYHALVKNNESAVLIISPQVSSFFNRYFEKLKKNCQVVIK
jgi:phosphatidylserine/phosphatidylglycerophosphate/cardiolipin synthase-like enzyme